jgi:hypothetical protein
MCRGGDPPGGITSSMTAGVRGAPTGLRTIARVPRNHQARLDSRSLLSSRWAPLLGAAVSVEWLMKPPYVVIEFRTDGDFSCRRAGPGGLNLMP